MAASGGQIDPLTPQGNAIMRERLKATGVRMQFPLGKFSAAPGATIRVKLQNIGITTRLHCRFRLNGIVGTALTISPFGWLRAINRIRVQDYDGQDRINATPMGIFITNCLRHSRMDGLNTILGATLGSAGPAYGASGYADPSYITASGASAVNVAVGTLDIPFAQDPDAGNLLGAIPTQTTVGELWLNIELNTAWYGSNDESKMASTGAEPTTETVEVQVFQDYILPQADPVLGGITPYPQLDLLHVNEITSFTTNDNLAAGAEKLITLPNVRNIQSINYVWINNSLLAGGSSAASPVANVGTYDISRHRIVVGGNTQLYDRDGFSQAWEQRQRLGFDFGRGVYFQDFAGLPGANYRAAETAIMGNLQIGVTPGSGGPTGTYFLEVTEHNQYMKGTPLGAVMSN